MVKCYHNTLGGAYGKVGYLTGIVRYGIKPAHPKPALITTPACTKRGYPAVTVYGTCPYTSLVRGSPRRACAT